MSRSKSFKKWALPNQLWVIKNDHQIISVMSYHIMTYRIISCDSIFSTQLEAWQWLGWVWPSALPLARWGGGWRASSGESSPSPSPSPAPLGWWGWDWAWASSGEPTKFKVKVQVSRESESGLESESAKIFGDCSETPWYHHHHNQKYQHQHYHQNHYVVGSVNLCYISSDLQAKGDHAYSTNVCLKWYSLKFYIADGQTDRRTEFDLHLHQKKLAQHEVQLKLACRCSFLLNDF